MGFILTNTMFSAITQKKEGAERAMELATFKVTVFGVYCDVCTPKLPFNSHTVAHKHLLEKHKKTDIPKRFKSRFQALKDQMDSLRREGQAWEHVDATQTTPVVTCPACHRVFLNYKHFKNHCRPTGTDCHVAVAQSSDGYHTLCGRLASTANMEEWGTEVG